MSAFDCASGDAEPADDNQKRNLNHYPPGQDSLLYQTVILAITDLKWLNKHGLMMGLRYIGDLPHYTSKGDKMAHLQHFRERAQVDELISFFRDGGCDTCLEIAGSELTAKTILAALFGQTEHITSIRKGARNQCNH